MADHADIMAAQDAVLVALGDHRPVPMTRLRTLPPWRAVMLARICTRVGAMTQQQADLLHAEATRVGGAGTLDPEGTLS